MTARGNDELKKILEGVLPQYEPIYRAPKSVCDFPEYSALRGREHAAERDVLCAQLMAAESRKLYKAIDSAGNVFLIRNPICRTRTERGSAGVDKTEHVVPQFVMKVSEALRRANT